MKRTASFILILFLVTSAAAENTLSLGDTELQEGQSILVSFNISAPPFQYGQVCVGYDESVVSLAGVDCGLHGCAVHTVVNNNSGRIQMYTGLHGRGMYGDSEFGSIKITATGEYGDMTQLHVNDTFLQDEHGDLIPCVSTDGFVMVTPLFGDVSRDKNVDVCDAILLLSHLSDHVGVPIQDSYIADVNHDGVLDILDVVAVINLCVGIS